jgi:hypothetical protein
MDAIRWTRLLHRLSGTSEPITWTDVVAGFDFSLLRAEAVQDWVRAEGYRGEACLRLLAMQTEDMVDFEERMWEACAECLGRVPRPGELAWARAQDRWRRALLREALEADLTEPVLAQAIEAIYECVGCPDDMLGLWGRKSPWQGRSDRVNFEALCAFLGFQRSPATAAA